MDKYNVYKTKQLLHKADKIKTFHYYECLIMFGHVGRML